MPSSIIFFFFFFFFFYPTTIDWHLADRLCASILLRFLFQLTEAVTTSHRAIARTSRRNSAAPIAPAGSQGWRIFEGTWGTGVAKDRGLSVPTARCARKRSRTCTGTLGRSIVECSCFSLTSPRIESFTRGRIEETDSIVFLCSLRSTKYFIVIM